MTHTSRLIANKDTKDGAARVTGWTSKMGPIERMEHPRDGLTGKKFGQVVVTFKKA